MYITKILPAVIEKRTRVVRWRKWANALLTRLEIDEASLFFDCQTRKPSSSKVGFDEFRKTNWERRRLKLSNRRVFSSRVRAFPVSSTRVGEFKWQIWERFLYPALRKNGIRRVNWTLFNQSLIEVTWEIFGWSGLLTKINLESNTMKTWVWGSHERMTLLLLR